MGIKITEFKKVDKGALFGFCSAKIDVWHMEIRSISVFKKDGSYSFALPSKQYDKPDGTKGYFSFIKLDEEAYKRFQEGLAAELIRHLETVAQPSQEIPEEDSLPF